MPRTMSCEGAMSGPPWAGEKMLFVESMSVDASTCASRDRGRWTAIWSPSKSALKAVQTRGWMTMEFPSTRMGSKAWMPMRCRVGARFSSTGCSWMTSSRMSQTSASRRSSIFFALLMVSASPISFRRRMMKGWNSSSAIFFGRPHWWIFSSGPTTMTERAE